MDTLDFLINIINNACDVGDCLGLLPREISSLFHIKIHFNFSINNFQKKVAFVPFKSKLQFIQYYRALLNLKPR